MTCFSTLILVTVCIITTIAQAQGQKATCVFPGRIYRVGDIPESIAVGDLNGDMDLDLAVTNRFDDTISILLNNGDGTYSNDSGYGAWRQSRIDRDG